MRIDLIIYCETNTAQKMKFSIKDFFTKCHQIRRKLRTSPHLINKLIFLCSEIVQPVTKYFEKYLLSFHSQKWNWTSLLSSKTECISCFTSCWTILKNAEISENLKIACRQILVPSLLPRNKYLAMVLKNWKQLAIKSSTEKAYFTQFRKLVSNIWLLVPRQETNV